MLVHILASETIQQKLRDNTVFVKKYAIYELSAAQPSILNVGGCNAPIVTLHCGLGGSHNSPEEAVQYLKDNWKMLGGNVKQYVILETWQYDECAQEEGLQGIPWA